MLRNLHPNPSLLPRPGCRHLYELIRDNLGDKVYTQKAGVVRVCLLGRGQTDLGDQYLAFEYTAAPDQPLPHLSHCAPTECNPHHTPTAACDIPYRLGTYSDLDRELLAFFQSLKSPTQPSLSLYSW